jgi:hypothetical protein
MNKEELIKKIMEKKEFSQLPKKDVEMVFEKFDKECYVDSEKIKLTRDLLRKIYSVFTSQKLLKLKDKDPEWILGKHISTKERFPYYREVYEKIFEGFDKTKSLSVFDLGAGINGFSYDYFPFQNVGYLGIEAMKQLVDLMNYYFKTQELNEAKAVWESLFELEKIKMQIKNSKYEQKIVFLFKVFDSLEMIEPDYSKKLLWDIVPLVDKVVISFATRSLVKKTKFKVSRGWILKFIENNFALKDDFELGNERYVVFKKK